MAPWYCIILLVFSSFSCNIQAEVYTPEKFAHLVGWKILQNPGAFITWDYGGAIIFDGLFRANKTFGINFEPSLNKYLDLFKTNPKYYGYDVLHNITVPFYHAVGDEIGLFPIAYLNRYIQSQGKHKDDFQIAKTVADDYILQWPKRLHDGTITRARGWPGETVKSATFVWADDQYMGLVLLARLSRYLQNEEYAKFVGGQRINFNSYLQDEEDGLFIHGYNNADKHLSCCKWGRANAWSIMASIEVALALREFKESQMQVMLAVVWAKLRDQAQGMLKFQSSDGRWHQVVNETSTYLETSCTAMTLSALARGVTEGFLDKSQFSEAIERAWMGLQKVVKSDGTVNGICIGTGIEKSVDDYEKRPTPYLMSGHGGLGTVLHAAVDYQLFKDKFHSN